MNETPLPTVLVFNVDYAVEKYFGHSSVVSPSRIVDYPTMSWTARIPGVPDAIECQYNIPSRLALGWDKEGKHTSWVDTVPRLSTHPLMVRWAVTAYFLIKVSPPATQIPVPFFLSTRRDLCPMRQSGTVSLTLQHYDQSADVQAVVAYFDNLDNPYCQERDTAPFLRLAHRITPQIHYDFPWPNTWTMKTSTYLPVSVVDGGQRVYGAMKLVARESRWWQWREPPVFDVELYWSDTVRHLEPGTVLERQVVWQENGVQKEIIAEVAKIVSPVSIEP